MRRRMSAFGTKRTPRRAELMSAFGGKADIDRRGGFHRAANVASASATGVTVCLLRVALLIRTFPHHSRGPLPGQYEPPPEPPFS
jgi:hypothetical protein